MYATATDDLFMKAQVQSFMQLNILVTVDFLAKNPCCCLLITNYVSERKRASRMECEHPWQDHPSPE